MSNFISSFRIFVVLKAMSHLSYALRTASLTMLNFQVPTVLDLPNALVTPFRTSLCNRGLFFGGFHST